MDIIAKLQNDKALFATTALFGLIGALYVAAKAFGLLELLFEVFVKQGVSLTKFGAGKGSWAVITGATEGIGKEFAHQFAQKKFNILLVSRTASKLDALAQDIQQKYAVEAKFCAMDFSKGDSADYQRLADVINSIKVGVLVNNVATNHDIPTPFAEEDEKLVDDIIEVNIHATLKVTRLVLPQMISNRTGLILNLGSFAGTIATPYLSVYSAGKAFLATWSQAVGTELAGSGIVVEHVNTYFVVTAMSKIRKPSFLIPMPEPYVRSVLSKIGVQCGTSIPYGSTPYPSHAVANWLLENLGTKGSWVNYNYRLQSDIRKRALRKRERETAKNKSQ